MAESRSVAHTATPWPAMITAALRVGFGLIWAVGAALTWMPDFAVHFMGYLHNAAAGQPAWNAWWFSAWIGMVGPHAMLFTWFTRIAMSAIAVALLVGFGGRTLYALGALFSLLIWSTAEGFGGPYALGGSNIGPALTYVFIFLALIGLHYRAGFVPYSLDYLLEKRWPRWQRVALWSNSTEPPATPPMLPVSAQILAIILIVITLVLLIIGLPSTLNVKSASPESAAAAISPLQMASNEPIKDPHDARLPPVPDGDNVVVNVISKDDEVTIASGVKYKAWTFGGTVPAPIIHVRQGQTITLRFTNEGTMPHSVDFHAAITPPSLDYVDIDPGEVLEFHFVADTPGAFVYHCGTPPVLLHMANGMYGAIIVDPIEPLPEAAASYVIVQSEWYTKHVGNNVMAGDYQKMMDIAPDEVVFNGVAFQYKDNPLTVKAGERVRFYFVNAGPSVWSAFHVIGGMFDKVYPSGDAADALSGVSTYSVAPGAGAVFDVILDQPGNYPFVDHSFAHLMKGAVGVLKVEGDGSNERPFGESTITPAKNSQKKAAPEPSGPYSFDAQRGEEAYNTNCAMCHMADGSGMAGTFPPLVGDAVVNAADPTEHIETVLQGASGRTIDGVTYPAPMPPFSRLSDWEIADIVNHERTSWGNTGKQITPDDVKALR